MNSEIVIGNREYSVSVIRSQRKSISLEVRDGDIILLRIPYMMSDRDVMYFLQENYDWVQNSVRKLVSRRDLRESTEAKKLQELSEKELDDIKNKIADRVRYYSRIMDVSYGKITIRNQKTRWGSCSYRGNLNFNYQLYYLPDELLDYVVIHELAHRRHMDHSDAFWAEVEKYCPDYRERRRKLKEYKLSN